MDLEQTERRTSARLQQDEADRLTQLAAGLSRLEVGKVAPGKEESDMAHALRTRRRLRRPLSSAR